ncbi:MAG: RNA polymerase sigma factor [Gemmataceae bacterium]
MPAGLDTVVRYLRRFAGRAEVDDQSDGQLLARFVHERDESAFAELVQRHGGMVLDVCRRILGAGPDAEDACQAAFIVLVQRASSVRKQESLGSWLHGVACRCALKARTALARRRAHERQAAAMSPHTAAAPAGHHDLGAAIDEEIARLPAKYREPVLLCYIQGKAYDDAARLLGCPKGTLSIRLSRARDLLWVTKIIDAKSADPAQLH